MDYIKFKDIKPGDYFVTEIGFWQDDNEKEFEDGRCFGHASSMLCEEYDEETGMDTPIIKCDCGLYADGEFFLNDSLGAACSNKVRYMTEPELEYFKLRCKENNYKGILNF